MNEEIITVGEFIQRHNISLLDVNEERGIVSPVPELSGIFFGNGVANFERYEEIAYATNEERIRREAAEVQRRLNEEIDNASQSSLYNVLSMRLNER